IRSNIKEAISLVERAVSEVTNLPVLKNILIKAENGVVSFTATNLEIGVVCTVSGKVIEDGAVAAPASILSNVITNIKSDRLNLETKSTTLEIKTDNYNASVQGMAKDDFPALPSVKNPENYIEIKSVFLKEGIEQAAAAAQ